MSTGRPILLLQLPVPEAVPQPVTGCTQMGAADLLLHLGQPETVAELLPDSIVRRHGDQALVDAIVERNPSVVGFTLNVWNVERSAWIAGRLRERIPDLRIWGGGPELAEGSWALTGLPGTERGPAIPLWGGGEPCPSGSRGAPDPGSDSHLHFPFDLGVVGEGEIPFAMLLAGANPATVPGVWLPGLPGPNPGIAVPVDLARLHDPYMAGMATMEMDRMVLAELWRGCRYACAFCAYHQGRGKGAGRPFEQVEALFAWARDAGAEEMYLLDPSLEQRPDFDAFLEMLARANRGPGRALSIFAELRAESITATRAQALARAGITRVEVGLQTVSREALRAAGRGFSQARFRQGMNALHKAGVAAKVDLMVGLPGDSPKGLDATLEFLDSLEFEPRLQVFQTQVLPGTRLLQDARRAGWRWQREPPYHFLSGAGWGPGEIDFALDKLEFRGQASLAPDDAPMLCAPLFAASAVEHTACPDSGCTLQVAFDLDAQLGAQRLAEEPFRDLARSAIVWMRTANPERHRDVAAAAVRRLLEANPFAGLTVAVEQPPGAPLGLLDDLRDAVQRQRASNYLPALFRRSHPDRRVCQFLSFSGRDAVSQAWLRDVRKQATVVWRVACGDVHAAIVMLGEGVSSPRPCSRDDLFLVRLQSAPPEGDLEALARTSPLADRIVLSDPALHWRYARILQRNAGEEW